LRYALAARAVNDGLLDADLATGHVFGSDRCLEIQGRSHEQLGSQLANWWATVAPEDAPKVRERFDAIAKGNGERFEAEHRIALPDGSRRWVASKGIFLRDDRGNAIRYVGAIQDISDRHAHEERLLQEALFDPLTRLPNRALFLERLSRCVSRARRRPDYRFAVLFMDLDRFKLVNDSLGHMAGDELLVAVARRLQACVRPGDTVSRFAGDEFTILLDDISDSTDAVIVAARILTLIQDPVVIQGRELHTNFSIGIATGDATVEQPEELLRDADTALYRAKEKGRGRFETFDKGMHETAVAQLELEGELAHAVDRNQIIAQWQPVIDLHTGRVAGFEALVRWNHPTRGRLEPAKFLRIAEESGQIVPIGVWVLEEAAQRLAKWRHYPGGGELFVSLNLSRRQITCDDFFTQLQAVAERSGVDVNLLKLELTESVLMASQEQSASLLERMKAMGVRLHLDDFGTGASSLTYLYRFPVEVVKIDASLIRGMGGDERSLEVVKAIVQLARNLGVKSCAEGVEEGGQLAMLRGLGCDFAQGFLFARPLDAKDADLLIRAGREW